MVITPDRRTITGTAIARNEASNTLLWRHSGRDNVSNHQPHDYLLNRLFRRRSKKTSKLRVTDLCAANSPVTSEFPAKMANNAENVSIWWRHHDEFKISRIFGHRCGWDVFNFFVLYGTFSFLEAGVHHIVICKRFWRLFWNNPRPKAVQGMQRTGLLPHAILMFCTLVASG